jgi:hypothetical protein
MLQLLSVYGKYILLIWGEKWEGSVNSLYLNVKYMCFIPHNVASTDLNLNQKSGKNRRDVLNTYDLSDH